MLEFSKIAGRYSVIRRLYTRGVTNAFLVRDERAGDLELVAEMTPIDPDGDRDRLERRRSVIGLLTQLEHPNLTAPQDLFVDEPYFGVAKTWEPGVPLDAWLERSGEESWPLRVALARDVLEGLAALHSSGLLHRDLRPRNIWVTTSGGRPMAQVDHFLDAIPEDLLDGPSAGESSAAETRVGEPRRRAPEVVRSGEYSRRSDIYAAGLLLFDLLGASEAAGDGVLTEEAIHTVPAPYSEVVRRACRPFVVERFDDGLDLLAAFDAMDLQRRLAEAGFDDDFGDR